MRTDLYESVTAKIVAELERGAVPWVKPWQPTGESGMPSNATTGKPYRGINVPLLYMAQLANGFSSARWLTFNQARDAGGSVRGGETCKARIYFYKPLKVADRSNPEETKTIPMLKEHCVYNVAQCDGLPESIAPIPKPLPELNAAFDVAMRGTGATVRHGGDRAFYSTQGDFIGMPMPDSFNTLASYRATLAHETTHWTGHTSRMNRDLKNRFGTRAYAAEELIAEMGAAFLCAQFGIAGELRHAGYIESWIALLQDDRRAIFTAASAAQKAVDFILKTETRAETGESQAVAA